MVGRTKEPGSQNSNVITNKSRRSDTYYEIPEIVMLSKLRWDTVLKAIDLLMHLVPCTTEPKPEPLEH